MGQRHIPFKAAQILDFLMPETVAVITPAFRAERWIVPCVKSVQAQTYPEWQHWIIADDGADYEAMLAAAGIRDSRLRFLSSGGVGTGASRARNVALDQLNAEYAAILDVDDRFKPQKLEQAVAALQHHAIVSVALDEYDETGRQLRLVGQGASRELTPDVYKWTCLSMDSMLVWDRRKTDARYDLELTNMTDLELLLKLYRTVPASWAMILVASAVSSPGSLASSPIGSDARKSPMVARWSARARTTSIPVRGDTPMVR